LEDVFYFTQSRLSLDEVAHMARPLGYDAQFSTSYPQPVLNLYIDETFQGSRRAKDGSGTIEVTSFRDYWQWQEWYDVDCLEPEQRRMLEEYHPTSSFMISYHPSSLPKLAQFLKRILEHHGGWVALDDDWKEVYDASSIDRICRPLKEPEAD
jgi:hypothetical protein